MFRKMQWKKIKENRQIILYILVLFSAHKFTIIVLVSNLASAQGIRDILSLCLNPAFVREALIVFIFKVVLLLHWPSWIGGLETEPHSSYQVINESLRHTGGVSKHSHWLPTTANLPLLREITLARCRLCGCAPLFMEYEKDWLHSAATPNFHPITLPLDPFCCTESCSAVHQGLHFCECTLLNSTNHIQLFKFVRMSDRIPQILMKEMLTQHQDKNKNQSNQSLWMDFF